MILVKGEADRSRSQLKRQTQKNNEIRLELDKFCKKRRDTASPDQVLSQIESNTLNQSSFNRRQYLSSHMKIQEFKLE
jgi:ribosomal protein L33